jgi:hypothetical protein
VRPQWRASLLSTDKAEFNRMAAACGIDTTGDFESLMYRMAVICRD